MRQYISNVCTESNGNEKEENFTDRARCVSVSIFGFLRQSTNRNITNHLYLHPTSLLIVPAQLGDLQWKTNEWRHIGITKKLSKNTVLSCAQRTFRSPTVFGNKISLQSTNHQKLCNFCGAIKLAHFKPMLKYCTTIRSLHSKAHRFRCMMR